MNHQGKTPTINTCYRCDVCDACDNCIALQKRKRKLCFVYYLLMPLQAKTSLQVTLRLCKLAYSFFLQYCVEYYSQCNGIRSIPQGAIVLKVFVTEIWLPSKYNTQFAQTWRQLKPRNIYLIVVLAQICVRFNDSLVVLRVLQFFGDYAKQDIIIQINKNFYQVQHFITCFYSIICACLWQQFNYRLLLLEKQQLVCLVIGFIVIVIVYITCQGMQQVERGGSSLYLIAVICFSFLFVKSKWCENLL
eukprot:TRINITY_DN6561_c0_g1_i1.p1 TRINITY_DN6561_c0_g1~~TRINITY_DN6561_c0_g1_i1.p1  ORF type:complete len:247 (-),score=-3.90 TRINITY_DN6561_c0_g1_i1:158-898(-)